MSHSLLVERGLGRYDSAQDKITVCCTLSVKAFKFGVPYVVGLKEYEG